MSAVTAEDIVEMLLKRIKAGPDPIDPYAVKIEGENSIGIEDPETGAMWVVTVEPA